MVLVKEHLGQIFGHSQIIPFFSPKTYSYRTFLIKIRHQRLKIYPCAKFQPDWTKVKGAPRILTWNNIKNCLMTSYLPHSEESAKFSGF